MANLDEFVRRPSYSEYMGENGAHVRLVLDTDEPIALDDFVGSFVGIGNQFEKYLAAQHPELRGDAEFFVKEVRHGSVIADLLPVIGIGAYALPGIVDAIDKAQVLSQFVGDLRDRLSRYFVAGGRDPKATKSDLNDFLKIVSSIARDPKAAACISSATFRDGVREVEAELDFTTPQARKAQEEIVEHRREMEAKTDADYKRVLLRFVRPSVEAGKPGRKSERGIIQRIHSRALPILYASDLAEQRVRHELLAAEGNVFHKLFDVDVNVELNSKALPVGYRIVDVHAVIEGDEEEDAA